MASAQMTLNLRIVNEEAVADLAQAAELLRELAEETPWRPEIKEIAEKLHSVAAGLKVFQKCKCGGYRRCGTEAE